MIIVGEDEVAPGKNGRPSRLVKACAVRLAKVLDREWREMPETRKRVKGLESLMVTAVLEALREQAQEGARE